MFEVLASSPAIVIVDPVADVSIPSPPDIVKSAEPVVSLAEPESVVKVTPVISPVLVVYP